jgi:hypothetical protein
MTSKRKSHLTKNRKSRRSQNKLNGGITFKSGKYGFFCNKETYNSLFGNVVKGQDAPSINKLNSQLSLKGYRLENNSGVAKLIISNGERALNAAKLIGNTIGYTLVSPILIGFVVIGVVLYFTDEEKALRKKEQINARTTSSYKYDQLDRILDKGLNAEIGYYKGLKPQNQELKTDDLPTLVSVNLNNDTEIKEFIDVFISLTHLQKLKIDCCVIINVNPLSANTYDRIVDKNPNPSVEVSNIEASVKELE